MGQDHSYEERFDEFTGQMEKNWYYYISITPLSLKSYQILENSSEGFLARGMSSVYRRYISRNDGWFSVEVKILLPNNWRDALKEKLHNQNPYGGQFTYEKMSFNSPPEVAIAKELDRRGLLYFPNCVARVGKSEARKRVIPDFLIFHENKWGVLEVSGKTYHTDTTKDYAKARELETYGNIHITHFDAMDCQNNPMKVIDEFLVWLSKR